MNRFNNDQKWYDLLFYFSFLSFISVLFSKTKIHMSTRLYHVRLSRHIQRMPDWNAHNKHSYKQSQNTQALAMYVFCYIWMVRSVVFILEYVFYAVAVVVDKIKKKEDKIPVNCLRQRHRHKYNETVLFVGNACTQRNRERERKVCCWDAFWSHCIRNCYFFRSICMRKAAQWLCLLSILLLLKRDRQANSHAQREWERWRTEFIITYFYMNALFLVRRL